MYSINQTYMSNNICYCVNVVSDNVIVIIIDITIDNIIIIAEVTLPCSYLSSTTDFCVWDIPLSETLITSKLFLVNYSFSSLIVNIELTVCVFYCFVINWNYIHSDEFTLSYLSR